MEYKNSGENKRRIFEINVIMNDLIEKIERCHSLTDFHAMVLDSK